MQQQAMPSLPFPRQWFFGDLGDARPCAGTYDGYAYDDLPPIPALDGSLSWLGAVDVEADRRSAAIRQQLSAIMVQAELLGLTLPPAFVRFMSSQELLARVPEYAGSWFTVWDTQLDPLPGTSGYVLRFMNDQQDCVLWYLYITPDGQEAVLAAQDPYPAGPSAYLEHLVRPEEDDPPLSEEQRRAVLANVSVCAPSFEAFLYRWWREATIYMKVHDYDATPLTDDERHYLAHCEEKWWGTE
jgi:hypothetical protein